MLRSLLPSRAFNRHFQKTEWAAVPPPSLSPRSFPFAVLQSIFGGQREPLKINHLGLKTPFPMSYSLLCLCVWLESQSRQSECGMSRKASPSVGLRQGRGRAGPVAPPFSPRPLLKRGAGGGGSGRNKALLKILQLCSADCMLGDAAWTICVGCQGWETKCGGRFGFLGCLHSSQ